MELQFNFKNFEPSEHLKKYAQNRFNKLEKYIKRKDSAFLQINMEVDKYRQIIENIPKISEMKNILSYPNLSIFSIFLQNNKSFLGVKSVIAKTQRSTNSMGN